MKKLPPFTTLVILALLLGSFSSAQTESKGSGSTLDGSNAQQQPATQQKPAEGAAALLKAVKNPVASLNQCSGSKQ